MLSTLIRTLTLALFALIATQTSALSFTLEVSGNISHFTDTANKRYVFSDQDLFAMPVNSISTSTSWTPRRKFDGVAVADILKKVGAKGQTLSMHALNDYYIDIPLSDVEKYNIILAYKMDGEMLKIRNFGPLFLVYPRDESGPELNSPLYNSRFIWQVNRIVIK
ncbi:molybdopterin-dependent oxidoreductase [Serratia rhizosphaerae]|uniref:molybdopterin-dependent oxidoreductase n=1 Tax=unclassified Serratia (in: enterobacteria) TaxID=2647522 RepID=UPI000CF7212D|nr:MULTISPECIES: molybdopterin-dependent oxidoreductase [unclassified Serratia (in: enterobacteria)]MBU3894035.1 molybdopterin-dependent oxidoreductase [Serratia rubidaea]AVJ19756.1 oxidoreductase [Serratia sp. MYb239]QNK32645.1 molybdopterin-dependent oxidoreductase [Serratia sp. JUb9]QPT12930.1 molybdopterin-dependent oxidoreductase [Serratia rubidaea]CAE1151315.1 Oxidoreductase molybdopterin binding domain [Serratia sp. Tan611]